ncbi:hypothetical protein WDW89_21790 [Deltaproteobacteria bacterium TL4]
MFSEDWNFEVLNQKATAIIQTLEKEGVVRYFSLPDGTVRLPATSNLEQAEEIVIVCSGYPERAGVWSYTLLDRSLTDSPWLEKTSMSAYFKGLGSLNMGMVVLDPHANELKQPPEASIPVYLSQLHQLYESFRRRSFPPKIILLGYSLGGDVLLRFLQTYPHFCGQTHALILVDPSPPHVGRRKLLPEVAPLVARALFYGLANDAGLPGEFAEITAMRLKLKPQLVSCEFHGEVPNLILPQILANLPTLIEK